MLIETEIKLRIPPELATGITSHPLVTSRLRGGWITTELLNQYYDSDDLALDRADLALRLRRDGDRVIQTLKGRGSSVAGLSVRNEWDWYLDSEALSLSALKQPDLPEALKIIDINRLQPLFRTDFTRTKGALCWQFSGEEVEIEIALDSGTVAAGSRSRSRSEPLSELELELRKGPPEALLAFAVGLSETLPLQPWDSAKAERGYRLIDPNRKPLLPTLTGWSLGTGVPRLIQAVAERLAARAVCWSERLYMDDPQAAQGLLASLTQLDALLDLQTGLNLLPGEMKNALNQLQQGLSEPSPGNIRAFRTALEREPLWGWTILSLARAQLNTEAQQPGESAAHWIDHVQPANHAQARLLNTIREAAHG